MNDSFISCDWGTSSFRLRLVIGDDFGIEQAIIRDKGIKDVFNSLPANNQNEKDAAFSLFLGIAADELIEANPIAKELPIILSGMASSSIGWRELPYANLPFSLSGEDAVKRHIKLVTPKNHPLNVLLISGIASDTEIMRGEDCELLGIASYSEYQPLLKDCQIILPGTHSKHAVISNGKMVNFHTSMTGELFDSISHHTILSSSLALDTEGQSSQDASSDPAFVEGVKSACKVGLMRSLFQVRTRGVLHKKTNAENRFFLSGLLIGTELCALTKKPDQTPLLLAASPKFSSAYQTALDVLGLKDRTTVIPPRLVAQAAIRGQATLRMQLDH